MRLQEASGGSRWPNVRNIRQNQGSDGQKCEIFVKIRGWMVKVDDSFTFWSQMALASLGGPWWTLASFGQPWPALASLISDLVPPP